ncbi:ABC-2 type transport system ATP-binding protein [Nitrosomonas eutropha]|uniref:ABC-2 type transport system ATP-binding protein n=1 Tax=Nitrosomonas eutropha TaxID=916 RepID=A0A1I7IVF8_9PROT|nr:ABC transporter ATP-binding protein [Nitrosomonas eutropha]SFU76852.1 ABC-2 type transport system ATP-binding protein [Nitrosomonas eutropha]
MTPAIEIQRLGKCYGALVALDNVDLVIQPGEFFALLGPNGAGKTTLISILAGLTRASHGTASVMGYDVLSDYREARKRLGVVPQELVYDPFFTVRETLVIQSGYFGLKQNDVWIDEILHHLDLTEKAHTNVRTLSGGMKRRLLIAQALVHKPPVIILDEPTAGVDVDLRQSLWQFIQQLNLQGHTIVLTTHYLEEAEALCNRVAVLKQGKIIALDSMHNLVHSTRGYTLEFRLSSEELPSGLQAWPGKQEGCLHSLKIKDSSEIETALSILRKSGIQVLDIKLLQPDLESVFMKLMEADSAGGA